MEDHNGVFDRVLTWAAVRRLLTRVRRQFAQELLVHIVFLQETTTSAIGALCPRWLLDSNRQLCFFIDWCEQHTFRFDPNQARAFPPIGEVLQDTPTILVVDRIEPYLVPILVQIVSEQPAEYYICMVYRFVRIADILDWLNQYAVLLVPFDHSFNGQRVFRGQEIETQAGAVRRIRIIPEIELEIPLPNTREPNGSLSRRSSLPDGRSRWDVFSDSSRQFPAAGVSERHAVLLFGINVALGQLNAVLQRTPQEMTQALHVVSGEVSQVRDVLLRVEPNQLTTAIDVLNLLEPLLPHDEELTYRAFLARNQLVEFAPLLLVVPQRSCQLLPHVVIQTFVDRPSLRRILQLSSPRQVKNYRLEQAPQAHTSWVYRSDGASVPAV